MSFQVTRRWAILLLAGLLFSIGFYILSAAFFVVYREVSATEGWYLLAAREVARGHLLYADFAFPEGPVLPCVYGLLLMPFGYQLLAGRVLSAFLGLMGAGLAAWLAARLPASGGSPGDARAGLPVQVLPGPVQVLPEPVRVLPEPIRVLPGLTLALLASLPYTIAQFAGVAPDALAALLLVIALLAASARRHRVLWSGVAMAVIVGATGTGMSLALVAVILPLYLVATIRPRRWVLPAVLSGALVGFGLVWGPFLLADPQATYLNTLGFHAVAEALPAWLNLVRGRLVGIVVDLPTIVLLLTVLAAAGLLAFLRASDRRAWLRREALPLTVGVIVVVVGLAGAPHPVAVPLACALIGYGLVRLWPAIRSVRWRQAVIALVTVLLGLGFVFQLTTCFDQLLLRPVGGPAWTDYRLNVSSARITQAAAYADLHSAPGTPWLTFNANLVMSAGRDVLPGLEAGPLSYVPSGDTAFCRRFHLVNDDILVQLLQGRHAGLVAFSDDDYARFGDASAQILPALRAGYYPLRDFDRYGQAHETLHLYVPRSQTSPRGGPFVPLEVRLGDQVAFLGYDLSTETGSPVPPDVPLVVHPGDVLHLTLYWRCLKPIDQDFSVFNHLVPTDGRPGLQGQQDGDPGHGWAPTSGWTVDEVIMDDWAMSVWADASAGEDTLEVGLYDPKTGARLPIFGPNDTPWGDRLLLGHIHIVR